MLDNALFQYPVKAREKFRNRIGCDLAGRTKEKFDTFFPVPWAGMLPIIPG
jgi:hypothetical protein